MATVQISDIYNPLTFGAAINEAQTEANRFISSGVVVEDSVITAQASAGGNIGELSGYAPLGMEEPDYSTDNPATTNTPANTTSQEMRWRIANANKSWSTMNLAQELALKDPVQAIIDRIGAYWAHQSQRRVIQSCLGLLADNIANDSSDMLVNIATDGAGAIAAAETISGNAVIDTLQTSGDSGGYSAIAMHSVVYRSLQKQNLIDFIPNARGEIVIPTYMGLTVVVDDGMPTAAGANRTTYTSIIFGRGAVAHGTGRVLVPSEMSRNESAGNGSGEDIIHSRRSDVFAPLGASFVSGSVAGQSATRAELALAANWDRVWERKNINLAFLQTNA